MLAAPRTAKEPHARTASIGSMNDLDAARLDDVKNWFRSWYGPNNAVLVLAGDIDLATARDKVMRFFGDIPPSASVPKVSPRVPQQMATARETATDTVPQTRIYKVWHAPPFGTAESVRIARRRSPRSSPAR
jgi:zinc protease